MTQQTETYLLSKGFHYNRYMDCWKRKRTTIKLTDGVIKVTKVEFAHDLKELKNILQLK